MNTICCFSCACGIILFSVYSLVHRRLEGTYKVCYSHPLSCPFVCACVCVCLCVCVCGRICGCSPASRVCVSGEENLLAILRRRWWKYMLLGLVDIEANYLVIKAYQYTTLTSVQVSLGALGPTVLFEQEQMVVWICSLIGRWAEVFGCSVLKPLLSPLIIDTPLFSSIAHSYSSVVFLCF